MKLKLHNPLLGAYPAGLRRKNLKKKKRLKEKWGLEYPEIKAREEKVLAWQQMSTNSG